ncbi:MAG: lipocalin family protein [Candidatus Nanopelagicales bacterium]
MGDRRALLGTGAVLVGMGSALLATTAVAAADPGDTADAAAQSSASPADTAAANTRRGASGPASAGSTARRANRGAAAANRPKKPLEVPAPVVDAPTVTVPGSVVPAAQPDVAPATVARRTVVSTLRNSVVQSVAVVQQVPAAATGAPAPAPVADALLTVMSAVGWGPAGAPAAALAAQDSLAGQSRARSAAAVGAAVVAAAAPPDPTQIPGAGALLPGYTNGVTGVQIGHSRLDIPGAFIGDSVAADWYFPTQADGTVDAQGVIYLQHGFGATNTFYSALAIELAQKTNSIVVAPTLSSIPFTFSGGCLICSTSQQAVADAFLDPNRTVLTKSALDAGYVGDLSELRGAFLLSGHSAGGGFASATAADYISGGSDAQDANLLGVVMFDGVSNGTFDGSFDDQIAILDTADIPVYQIAAPAQSFNLFGATTNALLAARPGQFDGVVLVNGSHVDSMLGADPIIDFAAQLVTKFSPKGSTQAVYNFSTGWINDLYVGATPDAPQYGLYSAANGQIIMGNTAAVSLPTQFANNLSPLDTVVKGLIDAVGSLFGLTPVPAVNTGTNGVTGYVKPPLSNGVTGVKTGSAPLLIPSGANGYNAPADWYFPTQADGSVQANGIIWLQHGFLGFNTWYADMAQALAQETNSIVVAPNIFWFDPAFSGEAAAEMFVGDRGALNVSANQAGYDGTLPQKFLLTGHSAGGRFATAAGAGTVENGSAVDLLGVVMFDGVSRPPTFNEQLQTLIGAGIPDYQIAAPPQSWNAWGLATQAMLAEYPDQFFGVQIDAGSHTDVIGGDSLWGWLGELGSDLIVKPSPPGGKAAVRTFATGWINDIYGGYSPTNPFYGIYGNPNDGTYVGNQPISMGQAGATTLPAPPPVDIAQYEGKWYEQGSVKQFFSIGLVNITATYTANGDGTVKVENAGNYFGPNGPSSTITGSAVPVTGSANTRLNVGFFFGQPNADNPGNYWILDYAPDYQWAIVGDANGTSGYILTRDQEISTALYDELVARAYELGVKRTITQTLQFPTSSATS